MCCLYPNGSRECVGNRILGEVRLRCQSFANQNSVSDRIWHECDRAWPVGEDERCGRGVVPMIIEGTADWIALHNQFGYLFLNEFVPRERGDVVCGGSEQIIEVFVEADYGNCDALIWRQG